MRLFKNSGHRNIQVKYLYFVKNPNCLKAIFNYYYYYIIIIVSSVYEPFPLADYYFNKKACNWGKFIWTSNSYFSFLSVLVFQFCNFVILSFNISQSFNDLMFRNISISFIKSNAKGIQSERDCRKSRKWLKLM